MKKTLGLCILLLASTSQTRSSFKLLRLARKTAIIGYIFAAGSYYDKKAADNQAFRPFVNKLEELVEESIALAQACKDFLKEKHKEFKNQINSSNSNQVYESNDSNSTQEVLANVELPHANTTDTVATDQDNENL